LEFRRLLLRSEAGSLKKIDQSRDDATDDINAADSAEGQSRIARHPPQDLAKVLQSCHGQRVLAIQGCPSNFMGLAVNRGLVLQLTEALVEVDQSRTAQNPLYESGEA